MRTKQVVIILVLVTLTAVGAQFKWSIPGLSVPITLQTLFLLLTGKLLRFPFSLAVPMVYILLGMAGLPVFAGGTAGWEKVIGPTGGFFVGMIVATGMLHLFPDRDRWGALFLQFVGAHIVVLVLGFGYLVWRAQSWEYVARIGPLLPGALVKSALAATIVYAYRKGRLANLA